MISPGTPPPGSLVLLGFTQDPGADRDTYRVRRYPARGGVSEHHPLLRAAFLIVYHQYAGGAVKSHPRLHTLQLQVVQQDSAHWDFSCQTTNTQWASLSWAVDPFIGTGHEVYGAPRLGIVGITHLGPGYSNEWMPPVPPSHGINLRKPHSLNHRTVEQTPEQGFGRQNGTGQLR